MSDTKESLELLSHSPLFQDLEPERLEALVDLFDPFSVTAGEVLVREGEPGDRMFFLLEGRVRVTRTLTLLTGRGFTDREKSFNILEASEFSNFGEVALISDLPRTASVVAEDDCRLLVLSRENFQKIAREDPEAGYQVVTRICQQLCELLDKSNNDVLKLATALSLALTPSGEY
jgi:CRP/FNR family cyclic AMP-dependent transcriptional regulator